MGLLLARESVSGSPSHARMHVRMTPAHVFNGDGKQGGGTTCLPESNLPRDARTHAHMRMPAHAHVRDARRARSHTAGNQHSREDRKPPPGFPELAFLGKGLFPVLNIVDPAIAFSRRPLASNSLFYGGAPQLSGAVPTPPSVARTSVVRKG